MTWQSPSAKHRDLERDWQELRGRVFSLANLTGRFYAWFPDVVWTEMPSNQFAQPIEMFQAGWKMDQRRDENGRLV